MQQEQVHISKLMDNLFRHEYGKLVAVLTHLFGVANMELAEDVVQDSLIEAMKDWPYKGVPENPAAWLYKVARNKALNILNRNKSLSKYAATIAQKPQSASYVETDLDNMFSEYEIKEDQLRMIFTSCHPALSKDSQLVLTLKSLCGFSISEIAHAFFTSTETINKRLVRARQKSGTLISSL